MGLSAKSLNFFLGSIRKFLGNCLMDPGSDAPGCIRTFPGNFLMRPLWVSELKIGSLQIVQIWLKRVSINKKNKEFSNGFKVWGHHFDNEHPTMYVVQDLWSIFYPENPIYVYFRQELYPLYPLVRRWRHSICFFLDGSTPPLSTRQKLENQASVWHF